VFLAEQRWLLVCLGGGVVGVRESLFNVFGDATHLLGNSQVQTHFKMVDIK
jgi:hypothetical protein